MRTAAAWTVLIALAGVTPGWCVPIQPPATHEEGFNGQGETTRSGDQQREDSNLQQAQRAQIAESRDQNPNSAEAVTEKAPTFLDLLTRRNLQSNAEYCAKDQNNKAEQWRRKYLCEVKYTDVVSAVSSFATAGLTIGLLAVGCFQFFVYLRQTRIMKLQAEIASKVVDLEQPYLLVANAGSISFEDTEAFMQHEPYHNVFAEIQILNYGRTPAFLSMVQATILFDETELFETDFRLCSMNFPDEIVGTERSDVVTIRINGIKFSHGMMKIIQAGKLRPFVYGRIRYSNGVGGTVESGFAFKAEDITSKFVRSPYSRHNYRRTYHGKEADKISTQPET